MSRKWKTVQKRNFLIPYAKLSIENIIQSTLRKLTYTGSKAISFSITSLIRWKWVMRRSLSPCDFYQQP